MSAEHKDLAQRLAELSDEEKKANLAAWNRRAEVFHKERPQHFSAIDEVTLKSRVLERYQAAAKAAGLTGYLEFGVSDAHEMAYGMGYPVLTRTIFVFSDDLQELQNPVGATVFQLDRGSGFEAPYVDFELNDMAAYNFASRADRLTTQEKQSVVRPYWLQDPGIEAFDITQPSHLRPGQALIDGRDTAFMFGGNSGLTLTLGELEGEQAAIDQYFTGVISALGRFATGTVQV